MPTVPFQPSLFGEAEPSFDASYGGIRRIALDETAWVDLLPSWVSGSDAVFERVLASRRWNQRSRWMYAREVLEPRLTAPWFLDSGVPLDPPLLEQMRRSLSARYGPTFDSIGFNLYRNGEDSVAWHTDRILEEVRDPIVALVSFGEPRKFLMRPKGGGKSVAFALGRGDLFVTGGSAQRTWEHCVPKVKSAGPRISLAFRHGMDPKAYAHKKIVEPPPGV